MAEAAIFTCSICGERSSEICVYCTKDACGNHRCERCKRCSDCCECDIPLSAAEADVATQTSLPEPAIEAPPPEAAAAIEPANSEPTEEIHPPQPENPIF